MPVATWYPLLPSPDLLPGASAAIPLAGRAVHVTRRLDGSVSARDEQGAPLLVDEANDLVFVWSGAVQPSWRVAPLSELGSEGWTRVSWRRLRPFRTTASNVMRDVVDNAHFEPVHHLRGAETRAWREGPWLRTVSQGIIDTRRFGGPSLRGHLRLSGEAHGLGLLAYRGTLTLGVQIEVILLSAVRPIDDESVQMWVGVSILRLPVPGASRFAVARFLDGLEEDYLRDAVYWESPQGRMAPSPADDVEARLHAVFDDWYEGLADRGRRLEASEPRA